MLEPTPQLFYTLMSEFFKDSSTSFITKLISKVEITDDDKLCPTLCIDGKGKILVNGVFWNKHISTKSDAMCVLVHELFHAILDDVRYIGAEASKFERQLMNISMDMRINAVVTSLLLNNGLLRGQTFFEEYYPSKGVLGLLRPNSKYGRNSKYSYLYNKLYSSGSYYYGYKKRISKDFASEESLRHSLKLLLSDKEVMKIPISAFIGDHKDSNGKEEQEQPQDEATEALKQQIREALMDKLKQLESSMAGYGNEALMSMMNVVESNMSRFSKAMAFYAIDKKLNIIKAMFRKPKIVSSVVPISPCKRDLVMLGTGYTPVLWKNKTESISDVNKGIAVYIDVSGSVCSFLPKILGAIVSLRKNIQTVFCFSNKIAEQSVKELREGKVITTGGTDFDCIIEHAVKNDIKKMIIFTDGYADATRENKQLAKDHITDVCMIYFGGYTRKNFFQDMYKKDFELDDIIKNG